MMLNRNVIVDGVRLAYRHTHGSTGARQLTMTVADPDRMTGSTLEAYLAPHRTPLGRASFFEHQVRHYDSQPTANDWRATSRTHTSSSSPAAGTS